MKTVYLALFATIILLPFGQRTMAQDQMQIMNQLKICDWLDRRGERDSSQVLLQQTLQSARRLNHPYILAAVQLARIVHFSLFRELDSLEQHLDPLLTFSEEHHLSKVQVEALLYKAHYLMDNQQYLDAIEVCEQANALARTLGDQRLMGRALLCKGVILRTSHNDTKIVIAYFYQSLEFLKQAKDTAGVIRAALLISSGEPDLQKNKAALQLAAALNKAYPTATGRLSLLQYQADKMPALQAISLQEEALEISKQLRIPYVTQHILLGMAENYQTLLRFDRAKECLDLAVAAFPGYLTDNGAGNYYELYRLKGDFKKAVDYIELARHLEDSLKIPDIRSKVSEWETKMNTREKEWKVQQQQKELANQRTRTLLLAAVLLLACIAGAGALQAYFKQKKARNMLALQNDTISRQAEELKSLEELKSRFFANVSHELRTPLSLILGPLEKLLRQNYWKEQDLNLLQMMQRNSKQLLKLVNEILDLSKLESGRLEISATVANWQGSLLPIVAQFSSFNAHESNRLVFDFQADPELYIFIDWGKNEKIIHNFLANAMKFTPPDGIITLTASDLGDYLLIKVTDTGPGIHPDDLPHIFDRFYQSKKTNDPPQGGTGIGLSLCRELAELMGGSVWAESEYGKGSTFYYKFVKKVAPSGAVAPQNAIPDALPLGEMHSDEATMPVAEPQNGQKKPSLLIVEDNAELRNFLQVILSDYTVTATENGKQASDFLIAAAHTDNIPDLIISDLMMPVMDGFQFLEWAKSKDAYRHIPFIMLTARTDVRVKLRALRIGVDDYLTKPFMEAELSARISNLLNHYRERLKLNLENGNQQPEQGVVSGPVISQFHAEWLEEVEALCNKYISDRQFNLDYIASALYLSERQFRRRLQQLTGLSPNHYLREIRLMAAKDLISIGKYLTIKEVGYAVGYSDTKYFSQLYKQRFGVLPSQYEQ